MERGVSDVNSDGTLVTWDTRPFAEGALRHAYQGIMHTRGRQSSKCVIKTFKQGLGRTAQESIKTKKTYSCSIQFANLFNSECSPSKKIEFPKPIFFNVSKNTGNKEIFRNMNLMQGDLIAAEPFIEGKYEKFNSNSGWNNGHDICQAFSHYTFIRSNNALVVCDLQGVECGDRYYLTDPAINSLENGQYGCTDLGVKGILQFFYNHRCNSICRNLNLAQKNGQNFWDIRKSTTYSWNLCLIVV